MADKIETFFSDFANSEIDTHDDYDQFLEIARGTLNGFKWELAEMNGGAYYVLDITAHSDKAWNLGSYIGPDYTEGTSLYRFQTIEGAREALNRFLNAAL